MSPSPATLVLCTCDCQNGRVQELHHELPGGSFAHSEYVLKSVSVRVLQVQTQRFYRLSPFQKQVHFLRWLLSANHFIRWMNTPNPETTESGLKTCLWSSCCASTSDCLVEANKDIQNHLVMSIVRFSGTYIPEQQEETCEVSLSTLLEKFANICIC